MLKRKGEGMELKLTDYGIEVGIDPSFDNDYEDSYCVEFSLEQLETMVRFLKENSNDR